MDSLEDLEYNPELDTNHVHCEPTGSPTREDSQKQVVVYGLDGRELPIQS
jgi:hypothetical protein